MQLIVGLGNIGEKYNFTRHNFGFLLVDKIINDYELISYVKKFDGDLFKIKINDKEYLILKPSTYMNLSGTSVLKAASFYKITPENILVLHDDIDINLGKIKFKIGGSSAGHNGLKSIDNAIGKNYKRLRLGVGKPINNKINTADHVLMKFDEDELVLVEKINEKISKKIDLILDGKINDFLNIFYQV